MKSLYLVWILLAAAATGHGQDSWYKAVYAQMTDAADGTKENPAPFRFLEFHVNERLNYCASGSFTKPGTDPRSMEDQKIAAASDSLSGGGILDYLARKRIVRNQGGYGNCSPLSEKITGLIRSGENRKVGTYDCHRYTGVDISGNPVVIWASAQLPWYVNCGFYLPALKEDIIEMHLKAGGQNVVYRLNNLEKRNDAFSIPEIHCN